MGFFVKILVPIFIFIWSSFSFSQDYPDFDLNCVSSLISKPPFEITKATSDLKRTNWVELGQRLDNKTLEPTHYLPIGSIVFSPFEDVVGPDETYRQVKILSIPSLEQEKRIQEQSRLQFLFNHKNMSKDQLKKEAKKLGITEQELKKGMVLGKNRAQEGQMAFVHKDALDSAGDYIFMLNRNASAIMNDELIPPHSGMKLIKGSHGFYPGYKCCKEKIDPSNLQDDLENLGAQENKDDEKNCFFKYQFDVINEFEEKIKSVFLGVDSCGLGLIPIPKDDFFAVSTILEASKDYVDDIDILHGNEYDLSTKGKVREGATPGRPLMIKPTDMFLNSSRYGFDDDYKTQAYMTPWTRCGFKRITEIFSSLCDVKSDPSCRFFLGDAYSHDYINEHSSHDGGNCFDLRPMTVKGDKDQAGGLTFRDTKRYSRKRTEIIIRIIQELGAEEVIFNDSKITNPIRKSDKELNIANTKLHDNHLHICLPKNEKLKRICTDETMKDEIIQTLKKEGYEVN